MSKEVSKLKANENTIRLNKALADAGVCSRRAADELLEAGKIRVNNSPAMHGQKINPQLDIVTVDNKVVNFTQSSQKCVYLLVNKPTQIVCTAKDPEGRETVLDILPEKWKKQRIYPVGRLDYFSEGLLLLTNDGELTFRLTHPGWHVPREYDVCIRGKADEDKLDIMRRGMTLVEGETLAPVEVLAKPHDRGTLLRMTLYQGINRQIRRMCRDLDLTILFLRRVRIGPISLTGLKRGEVREVTDDELMQLRQMVKL